MADRFTRAECGRDMICLVGDGPLMAGLCVACVCQPGWFRDADLRAVLAPDHDGRELVERRMPCLAREPGA